MAIQEVINIVSCFHAFVALSNLVVPWIIKDVIDQVLEQKDLRMLYLVIVAILVTFFIRALTTFGHRYLMGYIGQAVIMDIRNVLYHHLQVCPFPTMIAAVRGIS